MVQIHATARLRASPFHESAVAEGMVSASVYNRMIMPTGYGDELRVVAAHEGQYRLRAGVLRLRRRPDGDGDADGWSGERELVELPFL